MPPELKNVLWVKKSQILNNSSAAFIPLAVFAQKIKILTQVAISQKTLSDQIQALKSLISLTSQYSINENIIELLSESAYREINILESFKDCPFHPSDKWNSWMSDSPEQLLLKLAVTVQKCSIDSSHDSLNSAKAVVQSIIISIFGGFNETQETVSGTATESKVPKVPEKKVEKGKPARKQLTPHSDVSKQLDSNAVIPTAEEWPTFVWSGNLIMKFNNSKSKNYLTGNSIHNPWKHMKTLLKLLYQITNSNDYSEAYRIISLLQLFSNLCVPKFDYDIFTILKLALLKESGMDAGKNWLTLNIKPRYTDLVFRSEERIVHELENNELNLNIYLDMLVLQSNCLVALKDLYGAKLVSYQILGIAKQINSTKMINTAISQLSTISCCGGDLETAVIFSMKSIQNEGYSVNNLRPYIYSQCALVKDDHKKTLQILYNNEKIILHERNLESCPTGNILEFLYLEFDIILTKFSLNNSLDINHVSKCLTLILQLSGGKPKAETIWKIINIFEDDITVSYDIEEAYLLLKNIEKNLSENIDDMKTKCLLVRGLLISKYNLNPHRYYKKTLPVVEQFLSEMDEQGNLIIKENVNMSSITCDGVFQIINEIQSNPQYKNFFLGVEYYLKWKSDGPLLPYRESTANEEHSMATATDFKKEYRAKEKIV
jgi:hypothetical protein